MLHMTYRRSENSPESSFLKIMYHLVIFPQLLYLPAMIKISKHEIRSLQETQEIFINLNWKKTHFFCPLKCLLTAIHVHVHVQCTKNYTILELWIAESGNIFATNGGTRQVFGTSVMPLLQYLLWNLSQI